MKKWILFILLIPIGLFAQFTDDFSDGDLSNNPKWSGDLPSWTIDNNVLRSNDNTASNKFYLSTPSSQVTNVQWEFLDTLLFS